MTPEVKLIRYRHLRAINAAQQSAALKLVAPATLMDYGRRLGVLQGRSFVLDDESQMAFVFDLAVYGRRDGRSRAIDRYARASRAAQNNDEALMLRAAQDARFALWRIEERHPLGGLSIFDIGESKSLWLMDEGLTTSAPNGVVFSGRLMAVEDFVMTCGAVVPVDAEVLLDMWENMPRWHCKTEREMVRDHRFAVSIYRAALRTGAAENIRFQDAREQLDEMLAAE